MQTQQQRKPALKPKARKVPPYRDTFLDALRAVESSYNTTNHFNQARASINLKKHLGEIVGRWNGKIDYVNYKPALVFPDGTCIDFDSESERFATLRKGLKLLNLLSVPS